MDVEVLLRQGSMTQGKRTQRQHQRCHQRLMTTALRCHGDNSGVVLSCLRLDGTTRGGSRRPNESGWHEEGVVATMAAAGEQCDESRGQATDGTRGHRRAIIAMAAITLCFMLTSPMMLRCMLTSW